MASEARETGVLAEQRLEFEPLCLEHLGFGEGRWHEVGLQRLKRDVGGVREVACAKVVRLSEIEDLPLRECCFGGCRERVERLEDFSGLLLPAFVVAVEIDF